ncbi:7-cyano-7-deazaguanine synthase [Nitrospirillum viridazoti]|nr:7-cyano-7-deazaguanine synthase [Nitrospirillum amazonense]
MKTGLLLSGGMDSVAIAWWKRPDVAFTIDYGQRAAEAEIDAARAVCDDLSIKHEIIRVDCSSLGSGDMVGASPSAVAPVSEWWPFRNQLLLTLAGMAAIRAEVSEIMIGALRTDGVHADGRSEFLEKISHLMSGQEGGISVSAPAIDLDAVELIKISGIPVGILSWAHSCHIANAACGSCHGCLKHYGTWKVISGAPY